MSTPFVSPRNNIHSPILRPTSIFTHRNLDSYTDNVPIPFLPISVRPQVQRPHPPVRVRGSRHYKCLHARVHYTQVQVQVRQVHAWAGKPAWPGKQACCFHQPMLSRKSPRGNQSCISNYMDNSCLVGTKFVCDCFVSL